MFPLRIILMGNAGVGKTTLSRRIIQEGKIPRLSLDEIAWEEGTKRRPHAEAERILRKFIDENPEWILEGCYGDLIAAALPFCTELRFLNPGIETSLRHCRQRPWEPEKFESAKAQDNNLENLLEWVSKYEVSNDEFGLRRHREIFNKFLGRKVEYTSLDDYEIRFPSERTKS